MNATRNVVFLILAVMFLQLAGGLTGTLTPLALGNLQVGPVSIGVIAALHAAGFVAGSWTSPRALRLIGNIRLYAAAGTLLAASFLTLALVQHPIWWAVMRLVQGALFAYMFTSIESWLGASVPPASRGNVLGFYHTAAKVAILLGPFFIAGLSALHPHSYIWAALFLTLGLVPVCLTRQQEPPAPERKVMPLADLYRLAPAAVAGSAMAGVANTGVTAFLPDYFAAFELGGGGTAAAALGGAAVWIAAIATQWPAGVISDRVDRRLVVAVMAGVSAFALMGVPFLPKAWGEVPILVLLGIWGAGALSFYGVCSAHAIDRASPAQLPQVMSGILFVWGAGSIIGPILAGLMMRVAGHTGLFLMGGSLLLLLTVYMLIRVQSRPQTAATETSPPPEWASVLPTPLASAPLDAKADGSIT